MDDCCARILINTGYISETYTEHELTDGHDWLDDGRFCCPGGATRKHQVCHCKAGRWIES
jgi:hypothetical protein